MTASSTTTPRLALPVEVVAVRPVTPAMVRITVAGEGLRGFAAEGGDQWLRLFLPAPGQDRPVLPRTADWWPEVCRIPDGVRPIVRNYSVRAVRPTAAELDIDIVRHGDAGPGTRWAGRAAPGDRLGVLDESTTYDPPPDTPWVLLLADESGLPALGSIVEGVPPGATVIAYVEVPSGADTQDLTSPGQLTVRWLPRADDELVGTRLLAELGAAELPPGTPYVWLAGEQRMVRQARRHLVGPRAYPKGAVCFMSYWRRGRSAESDER